jgi:uncharacterized protein YutE (UPF0331/DUF86 family)
MVRQENLSAKIEQVERYLKLIEPFRPCDIEELKKTPERLAAAERFIYLICQSMIEAAEIYCKLSNFQRPETMSESFERIHEHGIISEQLCRSLVAMVGFRNALAHAYDKFNYAILADVLNNKLSDIREFIGKMRDN